MKKRAKIIYFLIGLIGVLALALTSDLKNTDWSFFSSSHFLILFASLLLTYLVIYILHTCSFKIILAEERKKIGFLSMLKICFSGFSLNNVTPAGVAGGEPYRIMELKRYVSSEKAVATSLSFTIFYMMGHFCIWFSEGVIYFVIGHPDSTFITVAIAFASLISLAIVGTILFAKSEHVVEKSVNLFSHLPIAGKYIKKFASEKHDVLVRTDKHIAEFKSCPKRLLSVLSIEYVTRLLESLEYYLIFRFLGLDIPAIAGILILSNASLMGNLLFFIPMQVGGRESGMKIALSWFTKETATIVPACIIYRLRELVCILLGVLFILVGKEKTNITKE